MNVFTFTSSVTLFKKLLLKICFEPLKTASDGAAIQLDMAWRLTKNS